MINSDIHIPATSSITTSEGSDVLVRREYLSEINIPATQTTNISVICRIRFSGKYHQIIAAAALPHVPGINGRFPV